jgi:hypothetical protein
MVGDGMSYCFGTKTSIDNWDPCGPMAPTCCCLHFTDRYCYFKRFLSCILEPSFGIAHNHAIWTPPKTIHSMSMVPMTRSSTCLGCNIDLDTPYTCTLPDGWHISVVLSSALLSSFQDDQYFSAVLGAHICSCVQRLPLLDVHRLTDKHSRGMDYTPTYPKILEPSVPAQPYRTRMGSVMTTD